MKRLVVFMFLVFGLFFLIGFVSSECIDSDDGQDLEEKGVVTFNETNYTDYCSSGNLIEYYCEDDEVQSNTTSCENDTFCEEGVCVGDRVIIGVFNQDYANETLKESMEQVLDVREQIKGFGGFAEDSLEVILDLDGLDSLLEQIELEYEDAETNEEFKDIIDELDDLGIPKSVFISSKGNSLPYYTSKDKIDLYILEEIAGGSFSSDDEGKYSNAIIAWNQKNIGMKLTFKEFSVSYKDYSEHVLSIFELNVEEKGTWDDYPYLIIQDLDDLEFETHYNEVDEPGYVYMDLTDIDGDIVFSTTEDVEFHELPMFVSPELNDLNIRGDVEEAEEKKTKWIWFGLVVFFLFILGVVIYVLLARWYDERYENHLFKSKNYLYNLVLFIQNEKKEGLTDSEIMKSIKRAGWKSEQATYVIRKYVGKRTGMFKIFPFGKKKMPMPKPGPVRTGPPSRRVSRRRF